MSGCSTSHVLLAGMAQFRLLEGSPLVSIKLEYKGLILMAVPASLSLLGGVRKVPGLSHLVLRDAMADSITVAMHQPPTPLGYLLLAYQGPPQSLTPLVTHGPLAQ